MTAWVRAVGRDPAVRAAIGVSALLGAWASTAVRADATDAAVDHLDWVRIGEAGLLLVAITGATIGARLRTLGLERAWWTAGADRMQILTRGTLRAVAVGEAVLAAWIVVELTAIELSRGLPLFAAGSGPGQFAILLGRWATCVALVALCGLLVGQVAGDAARATLLLVAVTVPFITEARSVLPAPPAKLSIISPALAARDALLAATRTTVDGAVDHTLGILGGVATVLWCVALTALVLRRDLTQGPARGPRDERSADRMRPHLALPLGLALAGALGWSGPHRLAPDVRWPLRPAWRTQVAHHRSSTQRAEAWLRCSAASNECPHLRAPGLRVPPSTRRVLEQATAITVAPARFQVAPQVIDAYLDLPDRRSGPVTVVGATVRLRLRADGHGGWVVADISPAQAVVQ